MSQKNQKNETDSKVPHSPKNGLKDQREMAVLGGRGGLPLFLHSSTFVKLRPKTLITQKKRPGTLL